MVWVGTGTIPLEGQRKAMAKETTTRVVLADDHDVVRQGLKRLLDRAPGIEVVGEASDGLQALETVRQLHPDVLLLDIEMPEMDGIEVARQLQASKHKVHILVLSAYDDREYIRALLDIGVDGYLVKGEAPGKIVEAVTGIARGQKGWVSSQIRKKLEKMHDPALKQQILSSRDLEILLMMAAGKTDSAIGAHYKMDDAECAHTLDKLLKKIGASNRRDALVIAFREGWIPSLPKDNHQKD